MKVAIIGSGISGLAAAHHLHRHAEITLFEAGSEPGGHVKTVPVETECGVWNVDTGFIVFNDRNYPIFSRMLEELEVTSQPSQMSFSVSDGSFEYASTSPAGLFARPASLADPRFLRMIAEVPRFQRLLADHLDDGPDGPSVAQLLEGERFSDYFTERLIVPQVSAVWSAQPEQMGSFPAGMLARFFHNHGMLSLRNRPGWRTVTGGSREYVRALIEPLGGRLLLNSPVSAIERREDGVKVSVKGRSAGLYDQVVVACHAPQALAMLGDATPLERQLLGAIRYQPNRAVLHTDSSLLPRRRRAWASWNYHLRPPGQGPAAVTYLMNRLQSLPARRQLCVTLNREDEIDPSQVIRVIEYEHPIYTPESVAAQRRWDEISGRDRIHYCGAYWGCGFHEDGARSGLRAALAVLGQAGLGRADTDPDALDPVGLGGS